MGPRVSIPSLGGNSIILNCSNVVIVTVLNILSGNHTPMPKKSFMRHVRSKNEISVNNAIIHLGMEFDGAQHRAADDAYNTAVIVVNMNTTKNGNERQ